MTLPSVSHENIDTATVDSFGDEWARFDQSALPEADLERYFAAYFAVFPWEALPKDAVGFDMGCGTGRWASRVAPRVGTLHCIEPAAGAMAAAKRNLAGIPNVRFHAATLETVALAEASMDFGYSLGVLHHIPDTPAALARCVRLLKPGAPFLVYLYYRFDDRPWWFRALWALSDAVRRVISRLPARPKAWATDALAALVYWPLARGIALLERLGLPAKRLPLYDYAQASFYTMRTDSRDRFGTPLEQRFTRDEIAAMMEAAGLTRVVFSEASPYWCAVGYKA
jgi:SAM-dependent methyltransferase